MENEGHRDPRKDLPSRYPNSPQKYTSPRQGRRTADELIRLIRRLGPCLECREGTVIQRIESLGRSSHAQQWIAISATAHTTAVFRKPPSIRGLVLQADRAPAFCTARAFGVSSDRDETDDSSALAGEATAD